MVNAYVGVACHEHVKLGVTGGFAQMCHGKAAPLRTLRPDDLVFYYSARTVMDGPADCRRFTAAGRVLPGALRQVEMMPGFFPYRRDVAFVPVTPARMEDLRSRLKFWTSSPSVGLLLRRGFFQVDMEDALLLAQALGATRALNLQGTPWMLPGLGGEAPAPPWVSRPA